MKRFDSNNNNNNNNKVSLRVAETNPKFVGRGMALVDPKVMEEMDLSTGDVLEISGKKKSYVLLWSSQRDDHGKKVIELMDILAIILVSELTTLLVCLKSM